ncbi:hypothetical protein [Stutzerimonas nitrititolerans]|uniref:hypothetical protein n=1 Tax=Stutzerimonas nitrititolerans TaxID=2482751 RepID=UPI00289969AA|nr:hypothetical protein [Stutzerimonas nitrititolerans]
MTKPSIQSNPLLEPKIKLRLAPPPPLDLALLLQQGEILEQAALLIESGTASADELEELRVRASEYCVLADSGRILLVPGTGEKLHRGYLKLKHEIAAWNKIRFYREELDVRGGER